MSELLCATCVNSIRCPTWAEWRCKKFERRIQGYKSMPRCKFYAKRPANFKEPRCQCRFCLENDKLYEEEYE